MFRKRGREKTRECRKCGEMGSCENWIIRSRTRCKGFLRQGHERKRSPLGDASLCMDTIWPEAHSRQL